MRHSIPLGWAAGVVITNPGEGEVLAETEPLESGLCRVQVYATVNPPGSELVFEWRKAGGTFKQKILPVTNAMLEWAPISMLSVAEGDQLRVIARTAIVGEVEVSIFFGGTPIAW